MKQRFPWELLVHGTATNTDTNIATPAEEPFPSRTTHPYSDSVQPQLGVQRLKCMLQRKCIFCLICTFNSLPLHIFYTRHSVTGVFFRNEPFLSSFVRNFLLVDTFQPWIKTEQGRFVSTYPSRRFTLRTADFSTLNGSLARGFPHLNSSL